MPETWQCCQNESKEAMKGPNNSLSAQITSYIDTAVQNTVETVTAELNWKLDQLFAAYEYCEASPHHELTQPAVFIKEPNSQTDLLPPVPVTTANTSEIKHFRSFCIKNLEEFNSEQNNMYQFISCLECVANIRQNKHTVLLNTSLCLRGCAWNWYEAQLTDIEHRQLSRGSFKIFYATLCKCFALRVADVMQQFQNLHYT